MSLLSLLPWWQIFFLAFGFGVIIGSFLNVCLYRFHTGKSLSGLSHCLSCQTSLRWYELLPLVSYLGLFGRCRSCQALIPSHYFWVELVTGLLFVAVVASEPLWWLWPVGAVLVSVLVLTAAYDIYHMVIPDEFVVILFLLALGLTGYDYYLLPDNLDILGRALGAIGAFVFFAGLWKFSNGRWIGFGDAKLAVPLALMLPVYGTFSMVVLSFWIGTLISLLLIMTTYLNQKRGQTHLRFTEKTLTIKSEVPFAPFLIIAFLLVFLFQLDVLTIISYVLPY